MKIAKLKINREDPTEISVHLESPVRFRALAEAVFWNLLLVFLGVALHRAYIHWTGF